MSSTHKTKRERKIPNWPSRKELDRVMKKLSRIKGVVHLPPDANAVDRAKWDLCAEFIKFIQKEEISQRELAKRLKTSEARVSEIVRYRLEKLTIEQLFRYLEKIKPDFKIKVA